MLSLQKWELILLFLVQEELTVLEFKIIKDKFELGDRESESIALCKKIIFIFQQTIIRQEKVLRKNLVRINNRFTISLERRN